MPLDVMGENYGIGALGAMRWTWKPVMRFVLRAARDAPRCFWVMWNARCSVPCSVPFVDEQTLELDSRSADRDTIEEVGEHDADPKFCKKLMF